MVKLTLNLENTKELQYAPKLFKSRKSQKASVVITSHHIKMMMKTFNIHVKVQSAM